MNEGKEEGEVCNRETTLDNGTSFTCCVGLMLLKVKDLGPGNQEAYLECDECYARYPE